MPAFVGLGAPAWSSAARGLLSGITGGTTPAHVASRGTLEAIAYQVRDVFDVMAAESGGALQVLLADGGASRNGQLMQFQADILGIPVVRSTSPELSALGAAYLAGLALGIWASEDDIAALLAGPATGLSPKWTPARPRRRSCRLAGCRWPHDVRARHRPIIVTVREEEVLCGETAF